MALNQILMMMDNKEWFYSKKTAFFGTFSMNYLDTAPSCIYHQGGLSYEAHAALSIDWLPADPAWTGGSVTSSCREPGPGLSWR